jgi:hypothetical protein
MVINAVATPPAKRRRRDILFNVLFDAFTASASQRNGSLLLSHSEC